MPTERSIRFLPLVLLGVLAGCAAGPATLTDEPGRGASVAERLELVALSFFEGCASGGCGFTVPPGAVIEDQEIRADTLVIRFNAAFAQMPFREAQVDAMEAGLLGRVARSGGPSAVRIEALGLDVRQLIPNALRSSGLKDASRDMASPPRRPLVSRVGFPAPDRGLAGRHIALWASHGWYYERTLDRWEWQRARLFTTVEDVLPTAFILQYLAPMLERAGADVWMPRERDLQPVLLIADQDSSSEGAAVAQTSGWRAGAGSGFALGVLPWTGSENPFRQGAYRVADAAPNGGETVEWTLSVPADGDYGVHVGFAALPEATPSARYDIRHAGGWSSVDVDQRMAGGTWVTLGTFRFTRGEPALVRLSNTGPAGSVVSADVVRLGGGTGFIARGGKTSGRARWTEAARYHMQFAGMPGPLVYNLTGDTNDYVDDYRGRAEWVNFLRGAPFGPNGDRANPGLGVPVDLSLAFHTDAGITPGDSTIGTLVIYSSEAADSARRFPDGVSRFTNRDLSDLMQSQITRDIRELFDEDWTRRAIWDRDYSEAVRPNVPSMLLELLSHQNFADMRMGLDPSFRFHVSRAVYKAVTRYLAARYGEPEPVIQPLAPHHLAARWTRDGRVRVSWRPRHDALEPTATPDRYRVQVRLREGGFDEGVVVTDTTTLLAAPSWDSVLGIRVVAENAGGRSEPSEVVAVGGGPDRPRVLIVAAFDRVGPPAALDSPPWRGFLDLLDQGVPDRYDVAFVGPQNEFDAAVPWKDDDDPGFGASYATWEGRVLPGNTFDFPALHGASILAAGFAFETVSDEDFLETGPPQTGYAALDLILGEERSATPGYDRKPEYAAFSPPMRAALSRWVAAGGALFVSGSYVGSELEIEGEEGLHWGEEVLGVQVRAARAAQNGRLVADDGRQFSFHQERNEASYAAESPDALDPVGESAATTLRYEESNMGAGVALAGPHPAITWGFPFETIVSRAERDRLMRDILAFLTQTSSP